MHGEERGLTCGETATCALLLNPWRCKLLPQQESSLCRPLLDPAYHLQVIDDSI